MLEFRIAAAQFGAAAITGVCAVIALAVTYLRATGRARSLGTLGVLLVVASPILGTFTRSLAVYGPNSTVATVATVGTVVVTLVALAGVVVLALALRRNTRRPARVPGSVGVVLVLLGVLARLAYQPIADRYLGLVDNEVVITALATDVLAAATLTGVGLLLFARALVVASRLPKTR